MKITLKHSIPILVFILFAQGCKKKENPISVADNKISSVGIVGTWKLVYGEIRENDSIELKDLSQADFIKILNNDHFAFINQPKNGGEGFYAGAGTYELDGNAYTEILEYIDYEEIRGHRFPFQIEIKGDTLIQSGVEDVPEAGIKRYIVEKYLRIE